MRSVKFRSTKPDQQARVAQHPLSEQPEQNAHVLLLSPCEDLYTIIAKRAYEFYGERGYRDGSALDDWLNAEREVLGRSPPA